MPIKDLRDYITHLEREGEIQRIELEVDWNLEVGAIIRRSYDLRAPAPFFMKIKGYPNGYRILGAPIGLSNSPGGTYKRLAISLGINPTASVKTIIDEYIRRKKSLIKPKPVSTGPCKENIHIGDDVDVLEFPVPFLHQGDGGRYIGTWHLVITKDPDSDWVNWGMYRVMVHDRKTLGGLIFPFQHIGFQFQKYEERNQPMEFAIAIGTEPVSPIIAGTRIPPDVNECDVVGGIRGEPLELVHCETVDLEVPAYSEIVLEGIILPNERKEEGPFGEYTGYRVSERAPRPIYHVKAITHRNDPILTVSCPGVPVDDEAVTMPLTKAAEILDELRRMKFPVNMVYCPPEGVGHLTIVSTKVPYPMYTHQLARAIWGSMGWGRACYYLVIVEDDIDVTQIDQVIWVLTTRCHPYKGIHLEPNAPGQPLLPFLDEQEKRNSKAAYVLFDCTWPKDWPKELIPVKASFDVLWPKEIQEKVLGNWTKYGYRG
jgi:4-hydroxy-3-polyprenylbenzoate decarboxylase